MKVVYLDQNKWIDVARAFHGKAVDTDLKAAFADIRRFSQREAAVFPLSWVHYLETAKNKNHERRKRLGTAMWELSRGHTMASYRAIVRFELESALAKRFPGVVPRDFRLVSRGGSPTPSTSGTTTEFQRSFAEGCPPGRSRGWRASYKRCWRRPLSRARDLAA